MKATVLSCCLDLAENGNEVFLIPIDECYSLVATCPRCSGAEARLSGGDEMVLESIRYEPAPDPVGPAERG